MRTSPSLLVFLAFRSFQPSRFEILSFIFSLRFDSYFRMFTFSKATSKTQTQPSTPFRFRTFNGWTNTIERVRSSLGDTAPATKPRKSILWLRREKNNPCNANAEAHRKSTLKLSISHPLPPSNCPTSVMVPHVSSCTTERVEVPGFGASNSPEIEPFHCTKVVLVASSNSSRRYRICRINSRKEIPWTPVSKPLPPLPSHPCTRSDTKTGRSSMFPISNTLTGNSLQLTFDDGLDDLSLFLRRIAYGEISASIIHKHLGYMEDGGRVLPLGRTTLSQRNRRVSPSRRYSSLMGVSLAIMEGRLPKALMVK